MKKLSLFMVLLLIVSLFPLQALAADDNGDGYNDHDVTKISAFLNQTSGGTTNAQKLGYTSADDPAAWSDVTWVTVGSEKCVQKINWHYKETAGSLDLSGCTSLTDLTCGDIGLTSLNVSGCIALSTLICEDNSLSSLDVSGCTALIKLSCGDNSLSSLDVSTCTALSELSCYWNDIVSLNVNGCVSLTFIDCSANKLTALDVNSCTNLKWMDCYDNSITSLDVSGCPLDYFICMGNPLKHIYAVIEGKDVKLNATDGFVKLTYMSYYVKGEKHIQSYMASAIPDNMPFTAWTATKDSALYSPDNSNVNLTIGSSYDMTASFASSTVYNNNELTRMQRYLNEEPLEGQNYMHFPGYNVDDPSTWSDVTWVPSPDGLRIASILWNNRQDISGTLDLSGYTCLETVVFNGSELRGLNLNGCSSLTSVTCANSSLDILGLSGCSELTSLKLSNDYGTLSYIELKGYKKLESLEFSNCYSLTDLDCSNNKALKTLNLSGATLLTTLNCSGSALTKLEARMNYKDSDTYINTVENPLSQATVNVGSNVISLKATDGGYVEIDGDTGKFIAKPNASSHFVNWTAADGSQVATTEAISFSYGTAYNLTANFAAGSVIIPVGISCAKSDVTTYGGTNGSVTITASGGNSGSYEYSLDDGKNWQAANVFNGLNANTYTAAVRDAASPNNKATAVITVGQPVFLGIIPAAKIAPKVNVGTALTIVPPTAPKGYTTQSTTFSSSKPAVATVDGAGNVTFIAGGKVTIIAKVVSRAVDKKGKVKIKITTVKKTITVQQPIASISLNLADTTIAKAKKVKLSASVAPATATNKKMKWTSSNSKVAVVSSVGVVTGKAGGTAVITCTATDGSRVTASCTVTVTPIYPTGIKLSKAVMTVKLGKPAALKATIIPKNADFKTITWASSNPAVATVDAKGKVKGIAAGKAVITVTTSSGQTASCTVTVQ